MRLSESLRLADPDTATPEDFCKWFDKAVELEELLLRARDELDRFANVVVHPNVRSLAAKKDQEIRECQVRLAVTQKQAQMYAKAANALKKKIEQESL